MDKKEMLAFIAKNPICYMATSDGNKPHVRAMGTHKVDESGIIYTTAYNKDVCKHLLANPEIEVCYFADFIQLRVSGRVEEVKDRALKQEIMENHPFYEDTGKDLDLELMAAFRLEPVEASVLYDKTEVKNPVDL